MVHNWLLFGTAAVSKEDLPFGKEFLEGRGCAASICRHLEGSAFCGAFASGDCHDPTISVRSRVGNDFLGENPLLKTKKILNLKRSFESRPEFSGIGLVRV